MINLELFSCAGGMAAGFARAGVHFDVAVDFAPDHCDSYERNIGHRPLCMDARKLLDDIERGKIRWSVDLLVADPPCTPWSRAGKRLGTEDERDMLAVTCALIAALRPRRYLIGNIPGLDDSTNLHVVQRHIGALARFGYCCADFGRLDAADYGDVCPCPLHDSHSLTTDAEFAASASRIATARERVAAPATTPSDAAPWLHAAVAVADLARATRAACADGATPHERLQRLLQLARSAPRIRHGKAADTWTSAAMSAFGVGADTAEIIGSWLSASWDASSARAKWCITSTATPPTTIRRISRSIAAMVITGPSIGTARRSDGCGLCLDDGVPQHRIRPFWFGHLEGPCIQWPAPTHCDPLDLATLPLPLPGIRPLRPWVTCREALGHLEGDELGRAVKMRKRNDHGTQKGSIAERPGRTVGTSNLSDGNNLALRRSRHDEPVHTSSADEPARAITTQCRAPGHATTIVLNDRHRPADADAPAPTLGAKYRGQGAQVLTYDPRHPPSDGDEPAMTVRAGCGAGATRAVQLEGRRKRPPSTQGPQSTRVMSPDAPSTTVHAREDRVGSGSPVLEWPWPRPATTVTARPGLAPPGHHDENFAIMSLPDAIILSERAAAILQGFPEDWVFVGKTKKSRWSQIGQAMPIELAHALATAVVAQNEATLSQGQEQWSHGLQAPSDHGESSRPEAVVGRDRPPQERRSDRQPRREPAGHDASGTLASPHAETSDHAQLRGVR